MREYVIVETTVLTCSLIVCPAAAEREVVVLYNKVRSEKEERVESSVHRDHTANGFRRRCVWSACSMKQSDLRTKSTTFNVFLGLGWHFTLHEHHGVSSCTYSTSR